MQRRRQACQGASDEHPGHQLSHPRSCGSRGLWSSQDQGPRTTPKFLAGPTAFATKLFETRYFSAINARSYDVSSDGQRFLMIKDMTAVDQTSTATPASIVVVLNWFEELKARLPVD